MERIVHIGMLLWAVLFFGVVVPGHQRGAVTVPDGTRASDGGEASRPYCPLCIAVTTGDPSSPGTPSDPARRCAICHLAGVIDAPTGLVFAVPQLRLLPELLPVTRDALVASLDASRIHLGRAPPSVMI